MLIAITMRVAENQDYPETRDALAQDWYIYIYRTMPQVVLVPLVNHPEKALATLKGLPIEGVILSNGNDWGSFPQKDETEKGIIDYCLKNDLPILGVCRGMQVLNVFFGGELTKDIYKASGEKHANFNHKVAIIEELFSDKTTGKELVVNSFHNQGIMTAGLSSKFNIFAKSPAGVVEGIYHRQARFIGIQWHPERENPATNFDSELIKALFSKKIIGNKVNV